MTGSIIEMNTFLRNTISKLCDAVLTTIAATRGAFAERLINRIMGNIEYRQDRIKYILEKEPREEEEDKIEKE